MALCNIILYYVTQGFELIYFKSMEATATATRETWSDGLRMTYLTHDSSLD